MKLEYKKPRYYIILIPFGFLLVLGVIGLIFYSKKYIVPVSISVTFGLLGTIWGLILLLYRVLFIYEAEFDAKGIEIKKNKDKIYISFASISNVDYEKPTLLNYLTANSAKLAPGILKVDLKKDEGKRKIYLIRLKYKDFDELPKKYKDLMKYPIY